MIWTGAVPVVTSLSTVALYLAYVIPVALGLRARLSGSVWPRSAMWSLGRMGPAVNVASVCYTAFITVVLVMPPNILALKTLLGVAIILALIYLGVVRTRFKGPAWTQASVTVMAKDDP